MRKSGRLIAVCVALLIAAPATAQDTGDPQDGQTVVVKDKPAAKIAFGSVTWDKIAGNWKKFKGRVRQQWGKLTHNDVQVANGRREILVGKIQARYGIDKDKADQQVELWLKQQK